MARKNSQDLYNEYQMITQKAADFNSAAAVLGWDQEVYMPKKGFAFRGRQLATLASQAHELITSSAYGELLHELSTRDELTDEQKINVRLSLEDYDKNKKLSSSFVERLTQQTSNSYNAWMIARKQNDFAQYAPELQKNAIS